MDTNNQKHTPGPWEFASGKILRTGTSANERGGMEGGILVAQLWTRPSDADAALIAAAPDLLVALKRILLEYLDRKRLDLMLANSGGQWAGSELTVDDDIYVIAARDAIAKAEEGGPVAVPGSRCPRCHRTAPKTWGCSLCNPEALKGKGGAE